MVLVLVLRLVETVVEVDWLVELVEIDVDRLTVVEVDSVRLVELETVKLVD